MKKQLFLLAMIFTIASCSKNEKDPTTTQDQLVPIEEMQAVVENELAQGKVLYWENMTDHFVYSAGEHSDQIYSIGYTIDKNFDFANKIQEIDLKSDAWTTAKHKVETIILESVIKSNGGKSITMKDIMPFEEETTFPQIIVKLTDINTISDLRNSQWVRFVEPLGFSITDLTGRKRSGSGCSEDPDYGINSADYTTVAPTSKVAWNFYNHSVPGAWSQSTGDNIRIAIIDTGASDDQDNLGSQFTSGYSGGRNILKYSTHYTGSWWWATLDSPNDQCGHGTSMAGLAAGPRGTDGNATGVAYKADLMTIRAVEDVVISTSNERKGVKDALKLAANNSSVKVISMSIGTPIYSSTVADGVYYAYNKGKLMVAAAGTSLPWTSWYPVIFPANMTQTTAVTGLKETTSNQKCTVCHSGPEVDFTIVMERANDEDRNSISLASYSNQPKYIGGSSCATATVAGIAALVWAENPSASRATVLNALKNASEFYPGRDNNFGWGKINATQAVSNI